MMRRDAVETVNGGEIKRLGDMLKALREAQGLTYDDVSVATHVRPHIIQAIENGTIESVCAPVYARGFMKTYCEYLMASDLWKKYSQGKLSQDDSGEPAIDDDDDDEEPVDIQHPTPIFRRSSIVWVYIILVMAVTGAAYLLWSQHRESVVSEDPFSLRFPRPVSIDVPAVSPAQDGEVSGDAGSIVSQDGESVKILPIPAPRSPDITVSRDGVSVVSGDLSWMYETSASDRPMPELPQLIDRTLLIEITGSNNKLTVTQGGKVVTRRTLGIGGRRSYDVTSDVKVTLSSGNKARVTWFGKRYESIGSDNSALTLVFHPEGSVDLVGGRSPHFAPGAP